MRRKSALKWKSAGFLFCLGMSLMTGCADKNIDYEIDGATESTQTEETGGRKGLEQFADATEWEDEWTAVNTKGNKVTLQADAKIMLPDTDQMSVVEVEEPVLDAAYRERIIKRIFGDGEVYYNDFAHLPKKEIQEQYDFTYERYISSDGEAAVEDELLEYEEALETAKDTYTLVSEYDVDEYLGKRDGISYELSFEDGVVYQCDDHKCRSMDIQFTPKDVYQVCPEEFSEIEGLFYTAYKGISAASSNACELSKEETQELAQSFVNGLGLDYFICTGSEDLFWSSGNEDYVANGYIFYWELGMDDVSFVTPGTQMAYGNYYKRNDSEEAQLLLDSRLTIFVTAKGVIGAWINNPLEITGVSEGVALLPLDTVKEIMKDRTTEKIGAFRFDYASERVVTFNEMELIYFRVKDKENPGHYSYVPTWRLSDVRIREVNPESVVSLWNPVLINAIDGSVIDFYDEV